MSHIVVGSIGFEAQELDDNCVLEICGTIHCTETHFVEKSLEMAIQAEIQAIGCYSSDLGCGKGRGGGVGGDSYLSYIWNWSYLEEEKLLR